MNLDFSEEQEMLREMVRGVCADHAGIDVVREMEDDPVGYPDGFWQQLRDLDLVGLLLPAEYGGSGMTMLEGVVVYEEFGRALAPSPHFVSAVMAGGVLSRAGSDDQKADVLTAIAAGERIVTPAWLEPESGFGPEGIHLTAETDGDELVLSGTKRHVAYAAAADQLLVLARSGEGPGGIDLVLVDRDRDGVELTQQMSIASDTQYEITFDDVRVPASSRVGDPGSGWATWHAAMTDGIILLAAYASGGASEALDQTVQYAKDREQFGKPLGAFQSIAHYLADAVTRVDGDRTLVHEAAWARSEDRPGEHLAAMAKLSACRTFRDVTAMAQQVWGGVGFTLEYDVQLYFRRAKALQVGWWNDRYLEELVAASVLDEALSA
ncbi:MAG: acyl-CoA dehydrogenase family protein [Actinomycetota bacterium]